MAQVEFKKADDELRIVWSEAYVPDILDVQDDFMTREEIMKMAYRWMGKSNTRCVDTEHDGTPTDAIVVESFIARKNDPDFIEGAWVVGVHYPDPRVWEQVKKGDINGFSIQGRASTMERVDVEVPRDIVGITKSCDDHEHNFTVAHAEDGTFIGGITDVVDGHYHVIRRGTLTEEANGHRHKYDFVRGVIDANGGA